MGFRSLNASIKKIANAAEKHRKAQLKARSAYEWLTIMRDEYIKLYNQPNDFTLDGNTVEMNKNALDFSIIYQSENTRSMNPVSRKEIKTLLKNLEKNLESANI